MANDFGSGFIPGDAPGFGVKYLTQQDLIDLAERILPQAYTLGLKNNGGWEFYAAMAKMFERVSLAIGRYELGQYILSAPRGALAECDVEFYRPVNASAPTVTMLKGAVVKTTKGSRFFALLNDVTLGFGVATATGRVRAMGYGYEYNVPGPFTTPAGDSIPGEIDAMELPLQSPEFGDPLVSVRQLNDATGGVPASLEQMAIDHGFNPYSGEGDPALRSRMRQAPNIITPEAVDLAVAAYCKRIGVRYTIVETWQSDFQTFWDGPDESVGDYDSTIFFYDDFRRGPPLRNRWLDDSIENGAFFVVVPLLPCIREFGMYYDDPADTFAAQATSLGERAWSYFDIPDSQTTVSPQLYLSGFYDGDDYEKNAFYAGLYQLLQSVKSYGVSAWVELEDDYAH